MTLAFIAALSYLIAAGLLARGVDKDLHGRAWLVPAVVGVATHAAAHATAWQASGSPDLHFFAALSLVGLGMAALTTLYGANGRMAALGVWLLAMHALDVYWLVLPSIDPQSVRPSWLDAVALVAVGGLVMASAARRAERLPALPLGDPSLDASLRYTDP